MCKRIPFLLVALVCGLPLVYGQQGQGPEAKRGLVLRVRKAGEADFSKDTKRFGIELYQDTNKQWVAITETGWLTAVRTPAVSGTASEPQWLHALELPCRQAVEGKFTKDTKRWGIEVFRDDATKQLIYICETGSIALVPATATGPTPDKPKHPTELYGMAVKCRKGGETDFTKDTKRFGIEVYRDENNGNLIYLTETGAIAVIPGAGISTPSKILSPEWLRGLDFRVRKAAEPDFTKDTRNFGAEVYKDDNTKQIFYITETGAIAVVPAGNVSGGGETKRPEWQRGITLQCRRGDEPDFTKDTKRWGIEVFQDPNTGMVVYLTETGSVAVPVK